MNQGRARVIRSNEGEEEDCRSWDDSGSDKIARRKEQEQEEEQVEQGTESRDRDKNKRKRDTLPVRLIDRVAGTTQRRREHNADRRQRGAGVLKFGRKILT